MTTHALLNFPDKFYIGVKDNKKFNHVSYPLAFATPFGTDAAFKKRKATVDTWTAGYAQWVDGKYVTPEAECQVIDNGFQVGFTLGNAVSREMTSNKWFEVRDPRGFSLQISADNLVDILAHGEIKQGVFIGKFIWGRDGGTMFLCRDDHPSYKQFIQPAIKRSLTVGDLVQFGNNPKEWAYCGSYIPIMATLNYQYTQREPTENERRMGQYRTVVEVLHVLKTKRYSSPWKLFVNPKDATDMKIIKSPAKISIVGEGHPIAAPTLGVPIKVNYSDMYYLFDDKKTCAAYPLVVADLKKDYKTICRNTTVDKHEHTEAK